MLIRFAALLGAFALAGTVRVASAQAPTPTFPCHDKTCALAFDWGTGKTSGDYGADRKYGSAEDFEAAIRSGLKAHGYRTQDSPQGSEIMITFRPRMRPRSLCDAMPGTNSDMTCTAMSDLQVTFLSNDPAVKAPSSLRISNRCGSGDMYLTMRQFGQFAADMIYFSNEGSAKKETKPTMPC